MGKVSKLEQAYIDREDYQKNHKRIPVSIKRQKELLKIYGLDKPFGQDTIEGKLTKEEDEFLMFCRIREIYGKPMGILEFFNIVNTTNRPLKHKSLTTIRDENLDIYHNLLCDYV